MRTRNSGGAARATIKTRRYGKHRSSYDSRTNSQVLNRKRVPLDILIESRASLGGRDGSGVGEKRENISPLDPSDNDEGENNSKGSSSEGDSIPEKSESEASLASTSRAYTSRKSESNKSTKMNDLDIFQSKAASSRSNSFDNMNASHDKSKASKGLNASKASPRSLDKSKASSTMPSKASSKTLPSKTSASTKTKSFAASASTARTKNTFRLAPRKNRNFLSPRVSKQKDKSPKGDDALKLGLLEIGASPKLHKASPREHKYNSLLPMPENITIRNKNKRNTDIKIWNDKDEVSILTGGTKKNVLRDVGNRKDSPPKADKCRTKSSRQKRKSQSSDHNENKRQRRDAETAVPTTTVPCVNFTVPECEPVKNGDGKYTQYQEKKYLGLIEGVGGGEEEKDDGDIPHRGRLLELPGEIMPGAWKAQLLHDNIDGIQSVRISLRHCTSMYSSLLDHLHRNDGNIFIMNPSKNRVKSFIDQGVLTDDEIEDDEEGDERVVGPFLGCIALVWFDGFTSASEAVSKADEVSEQILGLCQAPLESDERLCAIVKEEDKAVKDENVGGFLLRTKLDFSDEYSILVSNRGFEIDAVDVVFRKITVRPGIDNDALADVSQRGLTRSALSHHLDCIGSSVDDVMIRFKESDAMTRRCYAPLTYNAHVSSKLMNGKEAAKSDESVQTEQGSDELFLANDDDRQSIEDYGETNDALEADAAEEVSASVTSRRHADTLQTDAPDNPVEGNKLHGVGPDEVSAKQSYSADALLEQSHSPVFEGTKQRAYTTIHSPSDLQVNDLPKDGLGSENNPDKVELHVLSRSEDRRRAECIPDDHPEMNKACPQKIHAKEPNRSKTVQQPSPHALEAAKKSNAPEGRKKLIQLEKDIARVAETKEQQTSSKIVQNASNICSNDTNYRVGLGNETKSSAQVVQRKIYSAPSEVKQDRTTIASASRGRSIKASSSRVIKQQIAMVPTKRQNKHTPAPNLSFHKQRSLHAKTTSRKPKSSRMSFGSSANLTAKKLFNTPKSAKKKEYVADLFDEDLFGCPAKKTPAQRKSSVHLIEKNSCTRSIAKHGAVNHIGGKAVGRRTPTVNYVPRSSSPVVTPGKEVALLADSHDKDEQFHEAASVCFGDASKSPLIPEIGSRKSEGQISEVLEFSPPRCFHDAYFGRSPARVMSPSSIAKLMKTPDSHGAFHDNYYGQQQHCTTSENTTFAPLYTGLPFHDSYFGQCSHSEEPSSTALLASPSHKQATFDSNVGQQEIHPKSIRTRQLTAALLKSRSKRRNKMYYRVLLLILSLLPGAMQPKASKPSVLTHIDYSIFNTVEKTPSETTDSSALDAHDKVESRGWFSSWLYY